MKVPSCGVTFVLLHVGHLTMAFSLSEMLMVSSNGFVHLSHMNSYLGMISSPVSPPPGERIPRGTFGPSRLPDQEHIIVPVDALSNFQGHLTAAERLLHGVVFHLERLHEIGRAHV